MNKNMANLIVILVLMLLHESKLSMLSQSRKWLIHYMTILIYLHEHIVSSLPIVKM